jgi:hypothetical protein
MRMQKSEFEKKTPDSEFRFYFRFLIPPLCLCVSVANDLEGW